MSGQRWLDAEVDTVRRMYESGALDEDIADVLGRTKGSVSNLRQLRGITRPLSIKKLRDWTPADLSELRRLHDLGLPNSHLAKALGRSKTAIKRVITDRGIKRGTPPCPIVPSDFDTATEKWRRPISFPDYAVSNTGKVISLFPGRTGNRLRAHSNQDGYLMVPVTAGGRCTNAPVHLLVAEAFHGPRPSPYHEVAHGDGVRTNNDASNLRWATKEENRQDKARHGTERVCWVTGEFRSNAKLTDEQCRFIRSADKSVTNRELANKFGVDRLYVSRIRNGKARRYPSARGVGTIDSKTRRLKRLDLVDGTVRWDDGAARRGVDLDAIELRAP